VSDSLKFKLLLIALLLFVGIYVAAGLTSDNYQYFLSRRIPKALAMILASCAIGLSALSFQTVTQNRILTPSIMGLDALYLLTQMLLVALGSLLGFSLGKYSNFIFSLLVMLSFSGLLFALYLRRPEVDLLTTLLMGVVMGQLFSSLASFVGMLLDPVDYAVVQARMFASFNNIKVELAYLSAPLIALASYRLWQLQHQLDVLWLERDNAIGLGVDVNKLTLQVLCLSALLIAVATALVGPISFFGLLLSNLARELFNSHKHRTLLLAVALLSAASLVAGQWLVERVLGLSTTLSVIINLIGGLYFISLLLRRKIH